MNQVQAKYKLVGSPLQKVGVLLLLILFIRPDVQLKLTIQPLLPVRIVMSRL